MKFNFDKYTDENNTMLCETEEEAMIFLSILDSLGRQWCNGDPYLDSPEYGEYGSKTCYYFNAGVYGPKDEAGDDGGNLLRFSDYDWSEWVSNALPAIWW